MRPRRGFRSDNNAGLCPEAAEALRAANDAAHHVGYGDDVCHESRERFLDGCLANCDTGQGGSCEQMCEMEVDGQKQLRRLTIEPEVVSKDDVEMLQDLVVAAVNEARRKVDEAIQEKVGGLTGGMKIPGLT